VRKSSQPGFKSLRSLVKLVEAGVDLEPKNEALKRISELIGVSHRAAYEYYYALRAIRQLYARRYVGRPTGF